MVLFHSYSTFESSVINCLHPKRIVNFGLPSNANKFKLKKEKRTQKRNANGTELVNLTFHALPLYAVLHQIFSSSFDSQQI
jgi:hypothetical protein